MYLFLVVDPAKLICPKAKIPLVEFPAAEPAEEALLAAVAVPFVSVENVYLLRVVDPTQLTTPKAKIPVVAPGGPPVFPVNPKAFAENAPLVMTAGMSGSLKLGLGGVDAIRRACCLYHGIRVNIHAARIASRWSRTALPFWSDRRPVYLNG